MGTRPKKPLNLPELSDLSVDPSLALSLASLMSAGEANSTGSAKKASVVITEGIPPLSTKLVERIRKWEFIDLADLLTEALMKPEDYSSKVVTGQVILVQSLEQVKRKKKQVTDAISWSQAFAIYMAVLASAEKTKKEEIAGLLAHQNLVLQMSKDLGGLKWHQYDMEFREWAAAKGTRVWGELNLPIYGRCLAAPSRSIPLAPAPKFPPKRESKRPTGKSKACFKYNFEVTCGRSESECFFDHVCWHCGAADHIAGDCPRAPKRFQKGRTNKPNEAS